MEVYKLCGGIMPNSRALETLRFDRHSAMCTQTLTAARLSELE